jgi:hypothetical protein
MFKEKKNKTASKAAGAFVSSSIASSSAVINYCAIIIRFQMVIQSGSGSNPWA